jgi:glycosyltransferase involved in cell wall biosynthesis
LVVTVVIANYNQLLTLPLVLASMEYQKQKPAKVIIADDGSCDGSVEWLDALPDDAYSFPLYYVTRKHTGYGLTTIENLASHFAVGRIVFTNSDIVHHPESIQSHASMGDKEISGGLIREVAEPASQLIRYFDIKYFHKFETIFQTNEGKLTNHDYLLRDANLNMHGVWGGNFSVASKLFWKAGGYNEGYHGLYGGEESDLIQRLKAYGGELAWAYNSIAYHLAHPSREYGKRALGNIKYKIEYKI